MSGRTLSGARPGMLDGDRIILNFHGLGTPHDGVDAAEARYWCAADVFERLIDAVAHAVAQGERIEITFDDGNRSDLEIAAPILAARGLVATFFVCSGRLGKPPYLAGEDLGALEAMGMTIGSHGRDHVDLRRIDDAALAAEAGQAQVELAAYCAAQVDTFAIPFGSYDRRALAALGHFRRVYSSDGVRARGGEHPVPRVAVTRNWTPDTVAKAVARRESAVDRAVYRAKAQVKKLR